MTAGDGYGGGPPVRVTATAPTAGDGYGGGRPSGWASIIDTVNAFARLGEVVRPAAPAAKPAIKTASATTAPAAEDKGSTGFGLLYGAIAVLGLFVVLKMVK
jgi:hypothetical protein